MRTVRRGYFKAGIDSVRGAKWRNFWTMLGIIIAVSSVITVVSIGQGIKNQIAGQIDTLGKDLITVRPATLQTNGDQSMDTYNVLSGLRITGSLQDRDVQAVGKADGVGASAPLSAVPATVAGETGSYTQGLVIGTSPNLSSLINQSMEFGSFLSEDDAAVRGAVLGRAAADAMFESDVPLGYSFTINNEEFVVKGIFNDFPSTPLSDQANFDTAIFIPYEVAQEISKGSAATYEILARPKNVANLDATVTAIRSDIRRVNGGQDTVTVLKQEENIAARSQVLNLVTAFIAGIAAISLIVGGVGIMNVMLVSVTERMHEIGIRKAIGATNRQILSQFVIESSLLSLVGGLIGIALAFAANGLLRFFTNLQPDISWPIVAIATGVSLLVGIIFGSIPAIKAARKDPIEALRTR